MTNTQFLSRTDGCRLAYEYRPGNSPTVVFLGGYASDMSGTKAEWLSQYLAGRNQAYLRLDYSGHGQSDGEFADGTIGQWAEDARLVVDHCVSGDMILVGSSMGGWIMLLLASRFESRVKALIGIAAAPDFSEDLMWAQFDMQTRQRLEETGLIHLPSEYDEQGLPVTWNFITDGRNQLLLRAPIEIDCPVRLLQGMQDQEVPWNTALKISECLSSDDVRVHLLKSSDHRMSGEPELALLGLTLDELLDSVRNTPA